MRAYNRRHFLHALGAGAGLAWAAPGLALAVADSERRFVFIIQRGAADGLETLVPYADPDYIRLRGDIALDTSKTIRLDDFFALHSAMKETAGLYAAGEALFIHAVASPYQDRSHFDGQDVLETGGAFPYAVKDGWLNRLVGQLPQQPEREAVAFSSIMPKALRGAAKAASYAPRPIRALNDDLLERVSTMYDQDMQLHALWSTSLETRKIAMMGSDGDARKQNAIDLGKLAADFLLHPQGPRIAMIETNGWDTHNAQNSRLAKGLQNLDALIATLKDELGSAWRNTVILVATEFGRTASVNGTQGTDHGTASMAMLLGGAVQGGRVLADWPGLSSSQLYQNRDLKPTLSLDSFIASAASECFELDPGQLSKLLFPQGISLPGGAGQGMKIPSLLRSAGA